MQILKIFLDKIFVSSNDPAHNCKVYRMKGCAHVDGPLCDMRSCDISVSDKMLDAVITPTQVIHNKESQL